MRIASSVGQTRLVVASLALLAAGLGAAAGRSLGWTRCRARQPHAEEIWVSTDAVAGMAGASMRPVFLQLPPWFGEANQPPARIAGTLIGAQRGMTMRLAIDVPDPGVWSGREVGVADDGTFDFGPMPAGRYLLLAFGSEPVSRVTPIDTTRERGDAAEVTVDACHPAHGAFWKTSDRESVDATPAVGVGVELSGWILGTTDAAGAYDVCLPEASDDLELRVAGFADPPDGYQTDLAGHRLLWPEHLSLGFVRRADGGPATSIGVQPIWRVGSGDDQDCRASSVVLTTDAAGRFAYNGASRLCGFRVLRGTTTHDERFDLMRWELPQIVTLPPPGHERQLFDASVFAPR